MNAGNPDECMTILSNEGKEFLVLTKFQDLAYICAVTGSNLSAANLLREALGPLYLPPNAMDIHHAWMLQKERKYSEALSVLIPEGWTSQKQKEVGTTMQAMLFLETGQFRQSWFVAASPYVELKAKITIAHRLRDNGFAHEALVLFENTCPALENPEIWGCGTVIRIPNKK